MTGDGFPLNRTDSDQLRVALAPRRSKDMLHQNELVRRVELARPDAQMKFVFVDVCVCRAALAHPGTPAIIQCQDKR